MWRDELIKNKVYLSTYQNDPNLLKDAEMLNLAIEERRKIISKEGKYVDIRGILNIAHLLLFSALTKKSISSDPDTILLIEVTSTGGNDWAKLEDKLNDYTLGYPELRGKWKKLYAVFPEKNIQLFK